MRYRSCWPASGIAGRAARPPAARSAAKRAAMASGVDGPREMPKARASPVGPVNAARPGRTIGRTRKFSSSRLSRASRPARRKLDLPEPEAPRITSMRSGAPPRIRRSASSPLVICAVTAEEDRGVRLLERAQAAIGRAVRLVRRRPGEVSGVEAGAPEADPQTVQPILPRSPAATCRPSGSAR